MTKEPFLPSLRELARCYQAFEAHSAAHFRTLGLTAPQFDIIATLGNTPGMTSKELGKKTLITKGTLTGVVDRLVSKGLVRRQAHGSDGRCQIVQLTKKGEQLFDKIFPAHLTYLNRAFENFDAKDYTRIEASLRDLRAVFESGRVK
ncbi:MAG: MarR family winged helix-turn-helix transcriptional regulator [Sulfuricaulis sp.]